ncbi:steroid 17-alpha-hydroxylase/17,20 lyase-like [Actinia tenebrosa]|uniref:Steroid 21-hydroxylase n=1 Tax=Actinia tenebrosa TaxID=6105 RepID=A0A6P8IAL8_ACTTE|nr:steroid 17-alpha-hydroxylase/17,20 lyase-like [Actinia tenebrosa]
MIIELALFAVTVFFIYHFFFEFRGNNLPPGPAPWPIIGNANLLSQEMHLSLTKVGEQYGKIYRIYLGHKLMIVLSGDAIKEALVRQPKDFAGRVEPPFIVKRGPGLPLMDYGAKWKLYRKLGHSAIKIYGEGRLQEVISKEVDELCKRLEAEVGKPLDIAIQFNMAVTNVICTKLLGQRYEIDDPEFLKIYNINDQITRVKFIGASFQKLFPFLKFFLPQDEQTKLLEKMANERFEFLSQKFVEHKKKFDGETIRDYIDALLYTKQQAETEDHANQKYLDDDTIVTAGITSLFTAGSETTSTTLGWAIAYLLHNPDIQERLYKEIHDVIGSDEFPNLNQKKMLPTLEAFTAETQRKANLVPLAIPHKTTDDTVLEGYNIPKDTTVMANLWSLHHDPTIWQDPFKFNIDRFLDEEGNFKSPVGGTFLPFGAGPRVCLGEVLARSELFLFLCRLLQQFKFETPQGCELPSLEGHAAAVLHPKPYLVCVKKR